MTNAALALVVGSLLATLMVWTLPRRFAQDGVAAVSLAVLAALSPASALWLSTAVVLTPFAMRIGEAWDRRGAVTAVMTTALLAALFMSRAWVGPRWIGGAYFTLRHLHILIDWWMGRIDNPGLLRHARYQLFLPVLMAGPINRMPHFERQCARRRWDAVAFFSGLERALIGATLATVIGGAMMAKGTMLLKTATVSWPAFWREWLLSAIDWISLYFTFAGLTSVALGLSLMMGLRLEENFNRPWVSTNLIEFWTRWHMTLSNWCRDYVFRPITAYTRKPVLGVLLAMLFLGLWHGTSKYYVAWAVWQAAGIVLTRLLQRISWLRFPTSVSAAVGFPLVLGWLSLARPVIVRLVGGIDA